MTAPTSLAVGSQAEPYTAQPLTITDFVRYQGASGDFNPMHHDHPMAVAAGFDQPFAVGMLAAGTLGGFVARWLGPAHIRRFRVRFAEQAWPGDVLTYTGALTAVNAERSGTVRVEAELAATRQTGGIHLRGWATFELPAEGET
ncbi:MaoC/PaaZ C-terminal domain-containing protein [Mycolicibacterium sp. XJ1819]